jgi:hypothetical protein
MEKTKMRTVTLEVASRGDATRRALEAFRGKKQPARISFASPELLWKVLTAKRWELLKTMAGQGPLTIREVASNSRCTRREYALIRTVQGAFTTAPNVTPSTASVRRCDGAESQVPELRPYRGGFSLHVRPSRLGRACNGAQG